MAVSKAQKVEILNELVVKFKEAKSIGFASTVTMTVDEFSGLRKNLREVSATYTLAKKTLMKKALKEALNIEIDLSTLEWQIGVVCSNDDAVSGLGKVNDLVKSSKGEKITWASCIFEWELKNLEETKVIASMPSRDTLLSRMVGSMKSPISALARFFDAASKDLESKGQTKVWDLKGAAEAPVKEEVKVETPKAEIKKEEKKEEVKTEAPEAKVEAPSSEEKKEETK